MIPFTKCDLKKPQIIDLMEGGQIFVIRFAGLVSVYKNTHTGLKCLNANFVMPHNCQEGGLGIFLNSELDFFFFDDLHLQIIASISSKAAVENSSSQWAIFLYT